MSPLWPDLSHQFLAACCVKDNSEDADEDEDESPSSSRGEPAFEIVGTLSGPTKERLETFMLEYYTVSAASAPVKSQVTLLVCL